MIKIKGKIGLYSLILIFILFVFIFRIFYVDSISGWTYGASIPGTIIYFVVFIPFGIFGFILCISNLIITFSLLKNGSKMVICLNHVMFSLLLLIESFSIIFFNSIYIGFGKKMLSGFLYVIIFLSIITFIMNCFGWKNVIKGALVFEKTPIWIYIISLLSFLGIALIWYWAQGAINISKDISNASKWRNTIWNTGSIFRENKLVSVLTILFLSQYLFKCLIYIFTRKHLYLIFPIADWVIVIIILVLKHINIAKKIMGRAICLTPLSPIVITIFTPILIVKNDDVSDITSSFKKSTFSLNPNTPNKIIIFSDGLDSQMIEKVESYKEKLKDFNFFENMASHGFFTDGGFRSGFYDGEDYFNDKLWAPIIKIIKDMRSYEWQHPSSGSQRSIYQKNILNAINDILSGTTINDELPELSNFHKYLRSFVGNAKGLENWLQSNQQLDYVQKKLSNQYSGSLFGFDKNEWPEFYNNGVLEKDISEIKSKNTDYYQILNWRQARSDLTKNGFNFKSPFASVYEDFLDKANIGDPSYTYIAENLSHLPYFMSDSGNVAPISINGKQSPFNYLVDYLARLRKKLDSFELNGLTAWDNTEIIIWGDHSHHENYPTSYLEKIDSRKPLSALLYKPNVKSHTSNQDTLNIIQKPVDSLNIEALASEILKNNQSYSDAKKFIKDESAKSNPESNLFIKDNNPIITSVLSGDKLQYWLSKYDKVKNTLVPYSDKDGEYVLDNNFVPRYNLTPNDDNLIHWKNSWYTKGYSHYRYLSPNNTTGIKLEDLYRINLI